MSALSSEEFSEFRALVVKLQQEARIAKEKSARDNAALLKSQEEARIANEKSARDNAALLEEARIANEKTRIAEGQVETLLLTNARGNNPTNTFFRDSMVVELTDNSDCGVSKIDCSKLFLNEKYKAGKFLT
jgi:hypothetical protein